MVICEGDIVKENLGFSFLCQKIVSEQNKIRRCTPHWDTLLGVLVLAFFDIDQVNLKY